jgi:hypothetical protein
MLSYSTCKVIVMFNFTAIWLWARVLQGVLELLSTVPVHRDPRATGATTPSSDGTQKNGQRRRRRSGRYQVPVHVINRKAAKEAAVT